MVGIFQVSRELQESVAMTSNSATILTTSDDKAEVDGTYVNNSVDVSLTQIDLAIKSKKVEKNPGTKFPIF